MTTATIEKSAAAAEWKPIPKSVWGLLKNRWREGHYAETKQGKEETDKSTGTFCYYHYKAGDEELWDMGNPFRFSEVEALVRDDVLKSHSREPLKNNKVQHVSIQEHEQHAFEEFMGAVSEAWLIYLSRSEVERHRRSR